jgi:8-oxo-dGTP pyrophosphatase MutT (NUDIX family)
LAKREASGTPEDPVLAAGIVVWRKNDYGVIEFLLLQNALHHTWSYAKGHADSDDSDLIQTALRELAEETGVLMTPNQLVNDFADVSTYRVKDSYWKQVVYFLSSKPCTAAITCSPEHEAHQWLPEKEALALLPHQDLKRTLIRAAMHLTHAHAT